MVHAALLLLMLEAVTKDLVFTISLKRSTQNLQLSTSWAGRLPHFRLLPAGAVAGWGSHPLEGAALSRRTPISDISAVAPKRQRDAARLLPEPTASGVMDQVSPPAKISFLMTA